jgi:hypothetical protein
MTTARRRVLFGAALVGVIACVELGPSGGVGAISNLELPYPSVVLGDLLRDSLGNPSPLHITVFGANGDTLANEPVTFIALDTSVTVDADGTVHGVFLDTLGGGIVGGAGGIQTPPQRVIVTIAPTAATAKPDPTVIQFVNTDPDTTKASNWSSPMALALTGADGALAQGYVVAYAIVESPDAVAAGAPTAFIGNDAGRRMPRDTTDTKGVASRRVILIQSNVATDVRDGSRPDSVIVEATVKYLGADVAGSPVQFVVPVSRNP